MKPAAQPENNNNQTRDVVDEGLLLSYFLNNDSHDAHTTANTTTAQSLNSNEYHHRVYDGTGQNATTVRFAPDTIRTTTEQGPLLSTTPAVCFYPSTKSKGQGVGGGEEPKLAEKIQSKMHHSFPSFNSMASSLLKDTWPLQNVLTNDVAPLLYPMQSDVSPITPTQIVGFGPEMLILPPPTAAPLPIHNTTTSSTNPPPPPTSASAVDNGFNIHGNYMQWKNHDDAYPYPPHVTRSADLNAPRMKSSDNVSWMVPSTQSAHLAGNETVHIPSATFPAYSSMTQDPQPSIFIASMAGTQKTIPSNTSNNNPDNIHLQWLQQINSNIPPPVIHNPTGPLPTTANSVDFATIQTPIEFTPSGPFLNALSHIQRDLFHGTDASKMESEEKRARRLERNRESARQSRRRKKDRLVKLSAKVQKLQGDIDQERRKKIECMEIHLRREKCRIIQELSQPYENNAEGQSVVQVKSESLSFQSEMETPLNHTESTQQTLTSSLHTILETLGPNSNARRAVATFQYNLLRHLILCEYQKFILWLLFKGDSFLTFARDKHSKISKCSFRVPSKQIGEALATEHKKTSHAANNTTLSCDACDCERVWPYLCNELSMALDQEEKIVHAFHSLNDNGSVSNALTHIRLALDLAKSLQDGVLYQSHTSTFRYESTLLHILTPAQSALFLQWMEKNRDRVHKSVQKISSSRHGNSVSSLNDDTETASHSTFSSATDLSIMNELCEKLKGSLMIPTGSKE